MMASNMILMGEKIVLNQESVTQTAFSSMGFSAVVIGRGMRTVGTFSVNPKNGWFIRDNPIEMDDNWGYHDFGNLPSFTSEHKNHPTMGQTGDCRPGHHPSFCQSSGTSCRTEIREWWGARYVFWVGGEITNGFWHPTWFFNIFHMISWRKLGMRYKKNQQLDAWVRLKTR